MSIEKALAHKKTLIPEEGFNVVGVDTFEEPDEALYFIGHFATKEEAEKEKEKQEKDGVIAYIYTKEEGGESSSDK